MGDIAFMVGGLAPTGVLTLLFLWIFRKLITSAVTSWLVANAASLVASTAIAGFGMADSGPPRFADALVAYLIPQLVWLAVTGLIVPGRIAKAAKS